ncbi:hypothetical protein B0H13DRAFT_2033090 [Mycena leptocephala]|nr:hypothetical protein B0H13DRAFT_2033090 [Mycena leptocephala]
MPLLLKIPLEDMNLSCLCPTPQIHSKSRLNSKQVWPLSIWHASWNFLDISSFLGHLNTEPKPPHPTLIGGRPCSHCSSPASIFDQFIAYDSRFQAALRTYVINSQDSFEAIPPFCPQYSRLTFGSGCFTVVDDFSQREIQLCLLSYFEISGLDSEHSMCRSAVFCASPREIWHP